MQIKKHEVYENQSYVIPTIQSHQQLPSSQQQVVGHLVTEKDLNQDSGLKLLSNKTFAKHLQKSGSYAYFEQENVERYVFLYSKDSDVSNAFRDGVKHIKTLKGEYRNISQELHIVFSANFTEEYINEFIYGMVIGNFEWQLKSYTEEASNNSKLHIPFTAINTYHATFNAQNEKLQELLKVAGGKLLSTQLAQTRANIATTEFMFQQAVKVQQQNKDKVDIFYLKGEDVKKQGLNLMYAVGQASCQEPILVSLHYKGSDDANARPVALVGKGVIFDNGGLNLKMQLMEKMYGDKGGACSCLGIFKAIVDLGLKINVVCTMALVENAISSNAYRPSDIYKTYKGLTVEIGNTDAEGRNILADAMTLTQERYNPFAMFDIATLTGACIVSLGCTVQAIFSNSDEQAKKLYEQSLQSKEEMWHLPLTQWMRDNIVSEKADIRNHGLQPFGGSGTAAAFLENFVEQGVEWFHLDIAPSSLKEGEGQPIRAVVNFIRQHYIQ